MDLLLSVVILITVVVLYLLWLYKNYYTRTFIYTIYTIAGLGILSGLIGFYGTQGFDWKWNVFFLFPLYAFLIWAIYQSLKIVRKIFESYDARNNKNNEDL